MLNDEEVAALRRLAEEMVRVFKPRQLRATCVDGPLAGHRFMAGKASHGGTSLIVGWCLATRRGPVIAYYKPEPGQPPEQFARWRFERWDSPTCANIRIMQ